MLNADLISFWHTLPKHCCESIWNDVPKANSSKRLLRKFSSSESHSGFCLPLFRSRIVALGIRLCLVSEFGTEHCPCASCYNFLYFCLFPFFISEVPENSDETMQTKEIPLYAYMCNWISILSCDVSSMHRSAERTAVSVCCWTARFRSSSASETNSELETTLWNYLHGRHYI